MTRPLLALVALSFVGLFTGCGQSGPLYLPGDPSRIEKLPPAQRETEEEQKKTRDSDSSSS